MSVTFTMTNTGQNQVGYYLIYVDDTSANPTYQWYAATDTNGTAESKIKTPYVNKLFLQNPYNNMYIRCNAYKKGKNSFSIYSNYVFVNPLYNNYEYDYILNLSTGLNDITTMFTNANYIYTNNVLSDISLNFDMTKLQTYVNGNYTNIQLINPNCTTRTVDILTKIPIGQTILNILALKIFGHCKAKAAISNDTIFSTDLLSNNIQNYIWSNKFNIFNYYNGVNNVGSTGNGLFNFKYNQFHIPFRLKGKVKDLFNNDWTIFNGPNVGGALVSGGMYDIPLLIILS